MLDPDSPLPAEAANQPRSYLNDSPAATPSCSAQIREKIRAAGVLPFPEYMAMALYLPGCGYYAQGTRQVGRGGDFFTSVSVGPLYGELLARRFLREWQSLGQPSRWRVIECGAHDGTLAADILAALHEISPEAYDAVEYCIPEPLASLQAAQRVALAGFPGKVEFLTHPSSLQDKLPGVAFGNELLDALPFHVVEWDGSEWCECGVTLDAQDQFAWENFPLSTPALAEALRTLGTDFPAGYRTEIRLSYLEFLAPLVASLSSGLLLWPDYGFARPEYYHPARTTGTLRTFSKHRAAEDPLASPGQLDITAHVDFTAVAEAAIALGCQPRLFTRQGSWLTEIARDWLLSLEGEPPALEAFRQFQTLTHPAHLGGSFHVLEISWNQAGVELPAGDLHRLALRACPLPTSH